MFKITPISQEQQLGDIQQHEMPSCCLQVGVVCFGYDLTGDDFTDKQAQMQHLAVTLCNYAAIDSDAPSLDICSQIVA